MQRLLRLRYQHQHPYRCQDPKDEHDGILVTAMDRALQGQLHGALMTHIYVIHMN